MSANLKSKVSKTVAAKTLAELAAAGEIVGKAYGKTMIYCAIQVSRIEIGGNFLEKELIDFE